MNWDVYTEAGDTYAEGNVRLILNGQEFDLPPNLAAQIGTRLREASEHLYYGA